MGFNFQNVTMLEALNTRKALPKHPSCATGLVLREHLNPSRPNLIICPDEQRAEELQEQLRFFSPDLPLLTFPGWDTLPFELVSPGRDISGQRLACLYKLAQGAPCTIVTSIPALLQKTLPRKISSDLVTKLHTGAEVDYAELIQSLTAAGYRKTSLVQSPGEFAIRGAVIDCFTAGTIQPSRIEFMGRTIHKIRVFNIDSQRSTEQVQSLEIVPTIESLNFKFHPARAQNSKTWTQRINERARSLELPVKHSSDLIRSLEDGEMLPAQELISIVALGGFEDFLNFFPPEGLIYLDDLRSIDLVLQKHWDHLKDRHSRQLSEKFIMPELEQAYSSPEKLLSKLQEYSQILVSQAGSETTTSQATSILESNQELFSVGGKLPYQQRELLLFAFIERWRNQGYKLCFLTSNIERANLLQKRLLEKNLEAPIQEVSLETILKSDQLAPLSIAIGALSKGVKIHSHSLILLSESESLGSTSKRRGHRKSQNIRRLLGTLNNLVVGDLVVHEDHGIGRYQGLKQIQVEGVVNEFVQLDYADSKLFLPIHSVGRVQKYSSHAETPPPLDKLSSNKWQQTKQKVRKEVQQIAGDLIKLYATRSISKGFAYSKANTDDLSFAGDFPFDETPDQLKAIEECLADLAQERPMDRLICGDVGFGKTEVAMRAAFKVAIHGKQVAVLAPTTVLAEQHRESFLKRFSNFPVRIGALSRFYSQKSNKLTLELIKDGKLDIIIGTQALLQRQINFADLGLLIIDEEHRFGVKQKEQLKKFKTHVDVLTLTATPIPRTLHMSLLGIRDISVISTPPQQRQAVKTYIAVHENHVIRDAVMREIQRGGQVFFVHNRVQNIENIAHELRELLPELRIAVAHGQMKPAILERIMHSFVKHEIDILVSTTIIESGLDIPNANTIIINRADALGLSQLYQLRGRVGRSHRQAYAYLLIPKLREISEDAHERLKALEEIDDLGRGFNLALRDLEIRGAGNLLGQEQAGNVSAIGYDLYVKILQEAIYNLRGDGQEQLIEPEIKVPISAYLPSTYIPDTSERLLLYQRLSSLNNIEEGEDLKLEMVDRYGPLTEEVENLLRMMQLRTQLRANAVAKFELAGLQLRIGFDNNAPVDPGKLVQVIKSNSTRYKLKGSTLMVNLNPKETENVEYLFELGLTTIANLLKD